MGADGCRVFLNFFIRIFSLPMSPAFYRLLSALLLLALPYSTAAQAWQWAKGISIDSASAGNNSAVWTSATALAPDGTVYAAYQHTSPITVGGRSYPASADYHCVMVHHAANGQVTTPPLLVGGASTYLGDLLTDATGNLYASGHCAEALTLSGVRQPAFTGYRYFVVKWTATGALQWVKYGLGNQPLPQVLPGSSSNNLPRLTLDGAGRLTLAAEYWGTVTFGSTTVPNVALTSGLLTQYDAVTGALSWVKSTVGHTFPVSLDDVAAAPDGTLYVVGNCYSSGFNWAGAAVATHPTSAGFWMKLTPGGDLLMATRYGSPDIIRSQVVTDGAGTCYVAVSSYTATIAWGATTLGLPPGQGIGIFALALGTTGVPQWVTTASLPNTVTVPGGLSLSALAISRAPAGDDGTPPQLVLGGGAYGYSSSTVATCGALAWPVTAGLMGYVLTLDGWSGTARGVQSITSDLGTAIVQALATAPNGQVAVGGLHGGDTTRFGAISVQNPSWNGSVEYAAAFTAKLLPRYNQAQGTVFLDANRNSAFDATEAGQGGLVVEAQPSGLFYTTQTAGHYAAITDLSGLTVSLPNPPRYHTAVPLNPTVAPFATYGNLSTGHDFALQPLANQQDLTVSLTPITRARPGFAVRYRMTCRNIGTVPVAGAGLTLTHDPLLAYVSTSQPATHTGQTLTVSLGTLAPGETRQVDVLCQLNITAQLGHVLEATATLNPTTGDLTPADNTELDRLTVTGSYDPNDLAVNYATLTLPQVQAAARPLDYTARFQNMGTDTAFTVVLRDTLPAAVLNLGTLQLLSASHTCSWRLAPGGVLTVTFPNIQLPHRAVNTLRSGGYVRFRVVPWVTLIEGDLIPNRVQIYFDFNPAITTNTALTVVGSPTGLPGATADELPGGLWPNPATGTLHLTSEHPAGAALKLTLTDALGRTVRTATLPATTGTTTDYTFDLHGLAPGLYGVRAAAGGRAWSRRVVVQ